MDTFPDMDGSLENADLEAIGGCAELA